MIDAWEAATPGVIERINASIPLGRMAEPREVAEVGRVAAQRPGLDGDRRDRAGRRRRRRLVAECRERQFPEVFSDVAVQRVRGDTTA